MDPLWKTSLYSLKYKYRTNTVDLAIPFLAVYSTKTKTLIWKNISTTVFIEALFTKTKLWKKSKCPSRDELIKKINEKGKRYIHIYKGRSPGHKKEWDFCICHNIDEPRGYYTKWKKSDE